MEFCQNIQPYMQPHPKRNPGGDCFACALTAGLQFLFPDKQVDFNKVWEYFLHEQDDKKHLVNTWSGMQDAITEASRDNFKVYGETYIVRPQFNLEITSHNWFRFIPKQEYILILEGLLRSGWVVFTNINHAGDGPITPDGRLNHNDHFVIIDGFRSQWEPVPNVDFKASSYNSYVHVVCSAKGAYWIKVDDFLMKHGAAGWILMRSER